MAVRVLAVLLLAAPLVSPLAAQRDPRLAGIHLPTGFTIETFAARVPGARSLALGAKGTLFVGTRQGVVWAIPLANGRAGEPVRIAKGLNEPNGVAFRDGALYVAEISRILRFDGIEERLANPPAPVVVASDLPKDGHHGWKFIAFGPDGNLYVPVGAPCNVCERPDPYASILVLKPGAGAHKVYARGIRNTVGFDWHPKTHELWFTDNGRDWLGDDAPPDELNRAPHAGMHFGFPYCHGGDLADPQYGKGRPCSEFTPPAQKLGAHVAALGMRFYTGAMFPERYRGQILIPEHGSWNRTRKSGYRITLVTLQGDRAVSYEPFAEGWKQGESAWGRPVDLLVLPDVSLLVSDDEAGAIWRISYGAPK
jgi:glucose/arabinose dehydrogenase